MKKVYYLDDEQDLLDIFVEAFTSPEVQITGFSDPPSFIAAVKRDPPDLIFLDYRLPHTTGDLVAQQLDPAIPKVLITGDVLVASTSRYRAVLTKPFELQAVRSLIEGIPPSRS